LPPGPIPKEPWRLGGSCRETSSAPRSRRARLRLAARRACLHSCRLRSGARRQRGRAIRLAGDVRADDSLEGEGARFELDLDELFALVPERIEYRDVITYPPLRQDLAFVVDEAVPVGELMAAANEVGGEELREVRFLSDYRGEQIPAGKKSIAFSVAFQSAERTLNDDDAARLRGAIVAVLADRFGAELRA